MTTPNGDLKPFDLNDPNTYPDDPEELARLLDEAEGKKREEALADDPDEKAAADAKAKADEDAKAKADADAKAKEEADAKAKAEADAKAKADETNTPEGVLTADGKKVIPYTVLAETRRREDAERNARIEAEKAREELEARVKELEAEREKGGERPKGSAAKTEELRAQVEALKADVPEVAGILDSVLTTMNSLEEELGGYREEQERRAQAEREAAANRVQQAIDNIPALRYWQNEDADRFNEAAGYDKQLRENPKFSNLSTQERFERVVGIMEGLHGPIEVPEKYRDVQRASSAGTKEQDEKAAAEAKAKQEADEKARAEAKVKAGKGAQADQPLTLSDLPGGVPPQAGSKALEEMTTGDIEASVNRMLDSGKGVDEILSSYLR